MTQPYSSSAQLLQIALPYFMHKNHILDLACGSGRNGCYLASLGHQLTYLDKNGDALSLIKQQDNDGKFIQADLETNPPYSLEASGYDAILVFRYLHRPLMPTIIDAIKPGGLIIYETFTHQQSSIGRPKNPEFLLNKNELTQTFSTFETLHQFEGYDETQQAYIGQFIGRKKA